MSANIDSMIYVGEVPWHGLGVSYAEPPKTSAEIIEGAKLGWEVGSDPMYTEHHREVPGYHTVYRQDDMSLLGVVQTPRPRLVQNVDTFQLFDKLMGEKVDFETAASLGHGERIFGCFVVREKYRVLDDDIDHYFVVVNDHLQADGKITLLHTPIRVVCQNTLDAALSKNLYKYRMPITSDEGVALTLTNNIFDMVSGCSKYLEKSAKSMLDQKIDKDYVAGLLDELFPLVKTEDGESAYSKANERMEALRATFLSSCMGADNLGNYTGTAYQAFNAVTDYAGHFFSKVDKAYDLDSRMKVMSGIASDGPSVMVKKFLAYNKRKAA